jgi:hypothetical protein
MLGVRAAYRCRPSSAVGLAPSPSRWLLDPPPLSAIGTPRLGTLPLATLRSGDLPALSERASHEMPGCGHASRRFAGGSIRPPPAPSPMTADPAPAIGLTCDASVQKTVVEPPAVRFRRHGLGGSPSTCAKARKASERVAREGARYRGVFGERVSQLTPLGGISLLMAPRRRRSTSPSISERECFLAVPGQPDGAQSGSPSASRAASSELYVHRTWDRPPDHRRLLVSCDTGSAVHVTCNLVAAQGNPAGQSAGRRTYPPSRHRRLGDRGSRVVRSWGHACFAWSRRDGVTWRSGRALSTRQGTFANTGSPR